MISQKAQRLPNWVLPTFLHWTYLLEEGEKSLKTLEDEHQGHLFEYCCLLAKEDILLDEDEVHRLLGPHTEEYSHEFSWSFHPNVWEGRVYWRKETEKLLCSSDQGDSL